MQQININELKPHPRNNEFFDDMSGEKWKEFLESVKKRGIIEPIVITPNKMIVSGHQRVRACKELGIKTIMCDVHTYDDEDQILQDLLETNIRQRGDIGGSAKKVGGRIKELERLYGITNGGKGSNQYMQLPNKSEAAKTQDDIASNMNMSVDTLRNFKMMADMIPELEDLMDTGVVTKTTALAIMKNLSEDEQEELIESMDTTKKITQKEIQVYIDEIRELKNRPPEIIDNTDTTKIKQLENKIKDLQSEKTLLEKKARLNQEDSDRFNKLKSDIDFLTKRKSDLGRQIDSATELSGLTVKLQNVLEKDLAPIKFKRCMETLDSSDVCVNNLSDIINRIDDWSDEMKKLLTDNYDDVVDVQ